jgi:ADP-ribosylglycohydrolase
MPTRRERIIGFFNGVMLGDALGAPVEMMPACTIRKIFGELKTLVPFDNNKYLVGSPVGTTTDDTQLTLAVAESIIESSGVHVPDIAHHHVLAYTDSTLGWGNSTREAIERIIAGVEPTRAGYTDIPKRGVGNGVAMKAGPIGIHAALENQSVTKHMEDFTLLTHHTNMAVSSGAAWAAAIEYLLMTESYSPIYLASAVHKAAIWGATKGLVKADDDILSRMTELYRFRHFKNPDTIINSFGGGSPYVYDSLPFALMFFMQDPHSIGTGFRTLQAGGDADTTTSMVMSALGVLNGNGIFPPDLIKRVLIHEKVMDVANRFCNRFGVP